MKEATIVRNEEGVHITLGMGFLQHGHTFILADPQEALPLISELLGIALIVFRKKPGGRR